jgi:Uma2 family endonuclease
MHTTVRPAAGPTVYPDSDGKPMADNTLQFRWIQTIEGNLEALFRDRPDVFVAGDNLWYPVKGYPEIRNAPDVYVVFGRPKGHRGSYRQWEEDNVPLTVVFEILSPGNTVMEMDEKLDFYDQYGVEEYYLYDPDRNQLAGFVRKGEAFRRVRPIHNHLSPRLGIRFDVSGPELVVYHPDGRRFLTFEELDQERARLLSLNDRLLGLNARLRELSRKARLGQATADELRELEALEEPPAP